MSRSAILRVCGIQECPGDVVDDECTRPMSFSRTSFLLQSLQGNDCQVLTLLEATAIAKLQFLQAAATLVIC